MFDIHGARRGGRTHTPLRELDFESSASANSAIRAHNENHYIVKVRSRKYFLVGIFISPPFASLLRPAEHASAVIAGV